MTTLNSWPVSMSPEASGRWPHLAIVLMAVPSSRYVDESEAQAAADALVEGTTHAHTDADTLRGTHADEPYRAFYRSMGLKAAQVSNPVKQTSRVLANGTYRPISPVVDACMAIEYRTLVSFQAYGAAQLRDLSFAVATGEETIITSRQETKTCKPGELVLRSGGDTVHSCYYGNGRAFALGHDDDLAVVRIMRVPGFPADTFDAAVNEARSRLTPVAEVWLGAPGLVTQGDS